MKSNARGGAVAALLVLSTAACTTTGPTGQAWNPTIDQRNVDQPQYETDLAECRRYADANPGADADAAGRDGAVRNGAMVGVLALGATVATGGLALIPLLGGTLATSAGGAALMGGMAGRDAANTRYRSVVTACLQGRGYSVIG